MELRPDHDRLIRRINHQLSIVVVVSVIVGILIFFGLYRAGILGPIQLFNGNNIFIQWKISDHTSTGTGLVNQLNATDQPRYDNDLVLDLSRQSDGSVQALPRYQGQLCYFDSTKTAPSTCP